ncbi:MAG: hypothetical protein ABSA46_19285 [Thermodesulfovibrionales bacterium]|jgi:hypothetical protein
MTIRLPGLFIFEHASNGTDTEEALWELKDRLEAAEFWVSEIIDHGLKAYVRSTRARGANGFTESRSDR